ANQEDILAIKSEFGASVIGRMSSRLIPPPPCELLVFNPDKRLTADEALQHPYVKRFTRRCGEPALDYDVILPLDDAFSCLWLKYRNKLYEMILERKVNTRKHKRQILKESVGSAAGNTTEANKSDGKAPTEADPTATKVSSDPAGRNPEPSSSTAPQDTSPPAIPKSHSSQHSPKPRAASYNPITHSMTNGEWRGAQNTAGLPQNKKLGHQNIQEQPVASQVAGKAVDPHGKTAPVTRTRSFSLTQQARTAASNSQLLRKDSTPLGPVSVAAVSARLNLRTPLPQARDNRSAQKFSRKMFQGANNVGAAGDPKATLQSYTQAYGTISKSALQRLPVQGSVHGGT
uniref:Uncharacterized protein n=1 Tax=Leptobrachium leishanense TaxID=445787 RepID=A0A8C5ML86_9ANUR